MVDQNKNRLQDWAAIAEVVSSVAVIVTLVLLFFEVRNNTRVTEREALQNRTTASREFFINNPQLGEILAKIKETDTVNTGRCADAFTRTYSLSFREADTWCRFLGIEWFNRQAEYLYGSEEFRDRMRQFALPAILSAPDQALYWSTVRDGVNAFDAEFIEAVNSSGGNNNL